MAEDRPTVVPPVAPAVASESSPVTSSPVSITGGRPKLGPRRQSRFTEEPMTEGTPASSASVRSFDVDPLEWGHHPGVARNLSNHSTVNSISNQNTNSYNPSNLRHADSFAPSLSAPSSHPGNTDHAAHAAKKEELTLAIRGLVRSINSILHLVPCLILMCIMGASLRSIKDEWVERKNVQVLIIIGTTLLDALLDSVILLFMRRPWANWALSLRTFFGIIYLAEFFVYVGFNNKVFKEGYKYWGLPVSGAVPFAYFLIWWLIVWNFLHPILCRWTTLKSLFSSSPKSEEPTHNNIRRPSCFSEQRPTSFNPRISTVETEGTVSMVSLTWRRWVRTRSTHFSRDFDVEAGQRSRRGTVDEGVPMDAVPGSALVSATDITLKGDDPHYEEDHQDHDYEKRKMTVGGSSLVQQRSLSRLDDQEEDSDDDDVDLEKGRLGAKKEEERGGSSQGKRPTNVGQ
ncbi:hypothetical protein QBC38DRAFT_455973 [Podospora fimiseda]|uniref:Transmembrane protein n=1 Tax=Podospora fimiseda TaxID=252190 RepID=A0AAN7GTM4_9PEZI|nr:hypothetical protein QBC38DRAFT_455973 [Podospora fimiseda]